MNESVFRIPFDIMYQEFLRVLLKIGFSSGRAAVCARIFAENSLDGVYSHGLNRFLPFVKLSAEKRIDIHAEPEKVASFGVLEQWDGHYAPGIIVALKCMDRAVAIAKEQGVGCVAVRNNSHWMRAGTYGLKAADAGCIGICFTNTGSIIPPWGSGEPRLGNNPVVFAVPHKNGPILLDIALAQFSNGKLQLHSRAGTPLPADGGYDTKGRLTNNADEIKKSKRVLPIGLWKGSGLAFMLEVIAVCLSGGKTTADLDKETTYDYGVSQVFIAIEPSAFWGADEMDQKIEEICAYYVSAAPLDAGEPVHYPGQGMKKTREQNLRLGIPSDRQFWEKIQQL
ncbi:MAG: 3-dehydro-L-gulonate 2-dehydrogenase [Spirochaetales bacterium]|nr:3-dehydro-L-gulonate 2-dehydrogenase [Spirochaetales bacterium]